MRRHGLVGAHADDDGGAGSPTLPPAPDLLERDFTAQPDQRWVADITEFGCWDGKLYLTGIKDLHDQSNVGWPMGDSQTTYVIVNALVTALGRRYPADGELTHHADRGSQYTSLEFSNRMSDWSTNPSYSRSGVCFDNAAMESRWATIKREVHHLHGDRSQLTHSQLRTIPFAYIETFSTVSGIKPVWITERPPRSTVPLDEQPE